MIDYDPILLNFSNIRHTRYMLNEGVTQQQLIDELLRYPRANIVKIISHEPILTNGIEDVNVMKLNIHEMASRQRVFVDRVPYIDAYGFHVYVSTFINLTGGKDFDLRPAPEDELFKPNRI